MRHATTLTLALALATSGVLAAPAHAGPPVERWTPYSGTESYTECGYEFEAEYSGRTQILDTNPSLGGEFFRFSEHYRFTETVTNPETGESVTATARGVVKEIQPISLGDGIFSHQLMDVGTFTVRDESGRVVLRESGRRLFTSTFDTLSDGQPGGQGLTFELVRTSGQHPTWEDDFDICDFLDEHIG